MKTNILSNLLSHLFLLFPSLHHVFSLKITSIIYTYCHIMSYFSPVISRVIRLNTTLNQFDKNVITLEQSTLLNIFWKHKIPQEEKK